MPGLLRRRKIAGHGCVRNEELGIVRTAAVAAVLLFLLQHADDGVGRAIHHQRFADGGLAGKQLVTRLHAEHNHAPPFLFVVLTHQTAFLHLERAKALVFRPHAAHGARGRVVAADLSDVAAQFGTHGLDQVGFVLDGVRILNGQAHRASGRVTAGLFAGASTPDDGEVNADGLETLFLVAAESFAKADQQNDRSDSPDDPEHGQEAAQFVRGDGRSGLPQDFPDVQGPKSSRSLDGLCGLM